MSVNTLYGINGVGKDRIASELREQFIPDLTVTSASRLSMFLLGITSGFDSSQSVDRDAYKKLESVSQEEMVQLEEGPYRDFVGELAKRDERVLMLSHLVFALYLDKNLTYLTDRHIPNWYIEANQGMAQLVASPEEVLARRTIDQDDKSRDRPVSIEQIIEHQALCDLEWTRVATQASSMPQGMHVVLNSDVDQATRKVYELFYES